MGKRKRRKYYKGPDITSDIELYPGDIFELIVDKIIDSGEGLTFIGNNVPVIILGAIDGEKLKVKVLKKYPEKFICTIEEIISPSKYRTSPECKFFGQCTGCQWQHIDYSFQLELKKKRIENELKNYKNISHLKISDTIPSDKKFYYRNHARFTANKDNNSSNLGYVNMYSRNFVKIDECMIMDKKINNFLRSIQEQISGKTQVSIRTAINNDSYIIQPKLELESSGIFSGQKYYDEKVRGTNFRIAGASFFQVNIQQLSKAIDEIREFLQLSGDEILVDAYSGVGVFSILLSPFVKYVYGIEESYSAIQDAKYNSKNLKNIEFIMGKTEDVLFDWTKDIDYLLLDPPRIGCHENVLRAVRKIKPKKIIILSCEPKFFARDLSILCEDNLFKVEKIIPLDMFPQTKHTEIIAYLSNEQ
ncbi:MAG: SAM-dependent methyltransferase [Chloroflexi bacterium]|nr:SAM-dependent methyltransferase [Chloroflexota bacterium]